MSGERPKPGAERARPARSAQPPGPRPIGDTDPEAPARRRRPSRIGDLLPAVARELGLEEQLRLARCTALWDALISERVPPASGACRLVALEADTIVVAADEPIVAAELRMRAAELLDAFAQATGLPRRRFLRIVPGGANRAEPPRSSRV